MEIIRKKGRKLERYRVSTKQLGGEGEKLGTAYRLKSDEVVYIPECKGKQRTPSVALVTQGTPW
ncbi:MAG: DUF2149 domain-containing protein [Verrucomicrobiota bacterium]